MRRLQRLSLAVATAYLLITAPGVLLGQGAPAKDARSKKSGKSAPSSPVDINTASAAELESVPGIGAPTAKKIIAGRPYSSVADLSKAGLSASQIKSLSPMLKVSGSSAPSKTPNAAGNTGAGVGSAVGTAAKGTSASKSAANTAAAAASCSSDMVWVNTETKVYHKSGDKYFGNTKHGKCMAEADAQKAGYHLSGQKSKSK